MPALTLLATLAVGSLWAHGTGFIDRYSRPASANRNWPPPTPTSVREGAARVSSLGRRPNHGRQVVACDRLRLALYGTGDHCLGDHCNHLTSASAAVESPPIEPTCAAIAHLSLLVERRKVCRPISHTHTHTQREGERFEPALAGPPDISSFVGAGRQQTIQSQQCLSSSSCFVGSTRRLERASQLADAN